MNALFEMQFFFLTSQILNRYGKDVGISLVECTMTKSGRLELSCGYSRELPPGQEQHQRGQQCYMGREGVTGHENASGWFIPNQRNKQWRPLLEGPPKHLYTCPTECLFYREHLQSRDDTAQVT